jgi:hypothetical protein
MFRTQCQLRDVFRRHMELCRDNEDHVDIHRDWLLSLPVILLTQAAVTQVRIAVTQLRVVVSRLRVAVT